MGAQVWESSAVAFRHMFNPFDNFTPVEPAFRIRVGNFKTQFLKKCRLNDLKKQMKQFFDYQS